MSPEEAVKRAERLGLGAISVTDHNTFLGSYIALRRRSRVVVVPGAEFGTELGDALVLCEHVPTSAAALLKRGSRSLERVRFSSVVELAARENCVVVAVHPFAIFRMGVGRAFGLRYFDCVEVYNSSSDLVTNLYAAYAARGERCRVAGSDAHVPEMVGSAFTLVEVDALSAEGVLEGLRKARTRPCYSTPTWFLASLSSTRTRLLHSLRLRLGHYGDPWRRVSAYPI